MEDLDWIVFIYKVPSEPTKYRASIWREVKRLGGVYLQNGVCVFPDVDDVPLNVRSLGDLVVKYGGSEFLFVTKYLSNTHTEDLIRLFQEAREEEYAPLVEACDTLLQSNFDANSVELIQDQYFRLKRSSAQIHARDYFNSELGRTLTAKLQQLRDLIQQQVRGGLHK